MAISSRQAGANVQCPTCGEQTNVPLEDQFSPGPASISKPPEQTVPDQPHPESGRHSSQTFSDAMDVDDRSISMEADSADLPDSEPTDQPEQLPFIPEEIGNDDDDNSEAPLTFRRHKNLDEEMDLTPMVDVTFQLLIFFMVSASFSLQKSIEIPTPDPDQKGASQQVQTLDDLQGTSIIVKIDATNTIFIDDEPLGDPLRISDTLRDKMRREQKTELLVTADNQSLHRTIIAVIDAANEVGMQKIRMTSRKKVD